MRNNFLETRHYLFVLVFGLTLVGCSVDTVVSGLSEKEANIIVELLADNDIETTKG